MYRDAALRRFQYFVMTDWNGGVYASPGISGSRFVISISLLLPFVYCAEIWEIT